MHLDCILEPSSALIVDPLALPFLTALRGVIDTYPVLTVVRPLAYVLVTVGEDHGAIAVLLALHEVAIVALTVLVRQLALALEEILAERALICPLRLSKVVNTYSN